jgi:predicted DsbA family dithiol-disulfide isomerase
MKIDIVADTVCPWYYIGKRRFERALAARPQADLEIIWRPFFLNPDMPPEGVDRAEYMARKFGGRERAGRIYSSVTEAGATEDIPFRFDLIKRSPNTINSHRLIHFAGLMERQEDIVEAVYRAYFLEGRDIGDIGVLAELATEAGIPSAEATRYLQSGSDRDVVVAGDERARSLGVNGVPCFIIERKYAVSGAQLPEVFHQVFELVNQEATHAAE